MREIVLWLLIRIVFFAALNALFVHDWQTCAAFCAAFTLIHISTHHERRVADRERFGAFRDSGRV